jgi:hypothetical protein
VEINKERKNGKGPRNGIEKPKRGKLRHREKSHPQEGGERTISREIIDLIYKKEGD